MTQPPPILVALLLAGTLAAQADWFPLPAVGPRYSHAMAFDAARGEVVLFGDDRTDPLLEPPATWLWNGAGWRRAEPPTRPPPRISPAMAYDSIRRRVVLFGGLDWSQQNPSFLDDTWEWDGATWIPRPTGIRPPAWPGGGPAPRRCRPRGRSSP